MPTMTANARIIICLTILATALPAAAGVARQVEMRPRVAVMPVTAREGGRAAVDTVTALFAEALRVRGADCFTDADLRPVLRRHRIRSSMGLDSGASQLLADEINASHLVLVTVESWRTEPLLEVGITARLLRPGDPIVADAASAAATGEDEIGLFGSRRLLSPEELAVGLVDSLVADLNLSTLHEAPLWDGPTIAIVSLDAPSGRVTHADAATGWLLAGLVGNGLNVLEPGELRSRLLPMQLAPRGSVDFDVVGAVRDELRVDYVLTGSLDVWEPASGDPSVAVPSLAWGLRLIDAHTRGIVATFEQERDGRHHERLLTELRIRSLGGLALSATADIATIIRSRTVPASLEVTE